MDIIQNAPTGVLAAAGASSSDVDTLSHPSILPSDQPQVRYDAATNSYEMQLPGRTWEKLWTMDTSLPEWRRAVGISGNNAASIVLNLDRQPSGEDPYPYSTLAAYSSAGGPGWIAFGIPTAASAIPTTGHANYDGIIGGQSDVWVPTPDGWGQQLGVSGTVALSFDFGAGQLAGSMTPSVGGTALGTFSFLNGVYSAGGYSGRFDTSVAGANGFNGRLAGPNGEELVGGWMVPFHYSGDDKDHLAIGAWVGKRTP